MRGDPNVEALSYKQVSRSVSKPLPLSLVIVKTPCCQRVILREAEKKRRSRFAAEKPRQKAKIPDAIDLSSPSEWWGHTIESKDEGWNHALRRRFGFPGTVQSRYKDLSSRNGLYRFKLQVKINDMPDASWKPAIIIGAIDDEDWISVNGTLVGHTGKDTNPDNYYCAPRRYDFDAKLLKQGVNWIDLVLNDLTLGASVSGPMMLVFEDPDVTKARKLADTPYLRDVGREDDPYWHHGF